MTKGPRPTGGDAAASGDTDSKSGNGDDSNI